MQKLNLPEHKAKIRPNKTGGKEVLDPLRRRWVTLTPEENVRQSVINLLTGHLGYPAGLIAVETAFTFANGKQQRADIIVYDKTGAPYLLVECKAPEVRITESAFRQITRYNAMIRARYILVTNGMEHYSLVTSDFVKYSHLENFPPAP